MNEIILKRGYKNGIEIKDLSKIIYDIGIRNGGKIHL